MHIVPELVSKRLATPALVREAVRAALIAVVEDSVTFQPGFGHGSRLDHRFSMKAAVASATCLAGIKIGSYWPSNDIRGAPRHNSSICLIDDETGRLRAVIEAGAANALRTAAAHALAAAHLARTDATVLALFGAGHQAWHEVIALNDVRPLQQVLVINRTPERSRAMVARLTQAGIPANVAGAEEACRSADLIATVTAARAPLFDAAFVRPGTFVASMGSDGPGKQELPLELVMAARLVADLPSQSVRFGEFQHVVARDAKVIDRITSLGAILAGEVKGRVNAEEIIIFDSSGLALQDLYLGEAILAAAITDGSAIYIDT